MSFFDELNDDHSGDHVVRGIGDCTEDGCFDAIVRLVPPLIGIASVDVDVDDIHPHIVRRVARALKIDPERFECEMCDNEDVFVTVLS